MKNWWNGLSTVWKIVLIVIVLIIAIFIFDRITGGISDVKGWWFDRQTAARMAEVDKLSKENDVLRAKNVELEKKIVDLEAKDVIFEQGKKDLDAKSKQELEKLDQALAEQDAEEARTGQPTDAFTRCERTKKKMLDLNIKSATEINCNEYKQ